MRRIIVVEDNALVAKYIAYVLEHEGGYAVVTTESGDQTIAMAADAATAAIIVDVSLRDTRVGGERIDGLELTRRLKANHASRGVPVILATAHAMVGDRERFLRESGADGFIAKPITDPREVVALIGRLVGFPPV